MNIYVKVMFMINTDELCMSCMREIGNEKLCPYCGFHADSPQIAPYLPIRSTISNRYLVGKLIDYNGDGASYMGWDLSAKIPVVIREFMPDGIAERADDRFHVIPKPGKEAVYNDCLQSFTELWRKLMRLTGLSALVEVFAIIEENNTAYAIEEYVDGITLREYLLRTPTGYISWEKARPLFMPVLSTLGNLHTAGIIHRGISPTTLMIAPDGKLRITGFSISRVRSVNNEIKPQLFSGYAAIEQYGLDGKHGPWTDIYAFAAVLYRALIGSDPIDAKLRATNDRLMIPGRFAEQLPAYVINGLINALQIYPEDRTRNVEQCRAELSAAPSAAVQWDDNPTQVMPRESSKAPRDFLEADDEQDIVEERPAKKSSGKKTGIIIAICAVIVAVAVILAVAVSLSDKNPDTEETTVDDVYTEDEEGLIEIQDMTGWLYQDRETQLGGVLKFKLTYEFSDDVEEGRIISHTPSAGTKVKRGTEVQVVVSKGPKSIKLISVVGLPYEEAKKKLEEIGFTVVKANKAVQNDGSHAPDTVYRMSPSNLEGEFEKGSEVMLEVWGQIEIPTEPPTTQPPIYEPTTEYVPPTEEPTSSEETTNNWFGGDTPVVGW